MPLLQFTLNMVAIRHVELVVLVVAVHDIVVDGALVAVTGLLLVGHLGRVVELNCEE